MIKYDPEQAPDASEWLTLDESERIEAVRQYHEDSGVALPNVLMHATMHAVVESQLAAGEPATVQPTLQRLMADGLDRHDAIHAISSVLAEQMFDIVSEQTSGVDPNARYEQALAQLDARKWSVGSIRSPMCGIGSPPRGSGRTAS